MVRQCCQWPITNNMNEQLLKQYARLAVYSGVNLQKNQTLLINADIDTVEFTRLVVKEAYEAGAKEVIVTYQDDMLRKFDYEYQSDETLGIVHPWQIDKHLDYLKDGACRMHIISPIPGILKDCDPKKLAIHQRAFGEASREVREYTMASKVQWTIVAVPNAAWAAQVFPELSKEEAVSRLWKEILACVYVNEVDDPVETWKQRDVTFQKRIEKLNKFAFTKLHFKNELGTDLMVSLVKNHRWEGGSEHGQNGVDFNANIPTEEVFTMPDRNNVEGIVYASRPLLYNGNLIKDFYFKFEQGKVVDFDAKEGKEVLSSLLDMDEGSRSLGEVALVPYDSAISQSGTLFYTTLFDENASCHLALGNAYPSCVEGGLEMSEEELKEAGSNISLNHEDFMFGTSDMSILGETSDGTWIPVFKDGNFVI